MKQFDPLIVRIHNKKYEITPDKEFLQHLNALQKDRNDHIDVKLKHVTDWCKECIAENKDLKKDIDKLVNDFLEKNLSRLTYSGRFSVTEKTPPIIDNFVTIMKPKHTVTKPHIVDISKIETPKGSS